MFIDEKTIASGVLTIPLAIIVGWQVSWWLLVPVLIVGIAVTMWFWLQSLKQHVLALLDIAKNPVAYASNPERLKELAIDRLPFWARPFAGIVARTAQKRIASLRSAPLD